MTDSIAADHPAFALVRNENIAVAVRCGDWLSVTVTSPPDEDAVAACVAAVLEAHPTLAAAESALAAQRADLLAQLDETARLLVDELAVHEAAAKELARRSEGQRQAATRN